MEALPFDPQASRPPKQIILMRGLPSCGKSWTARKIAQERHGEVFEFDEYFRHVENGQATFRWRSSELGRARKHQFSRVKSAIDRGISPVVVDDDHRPGPTAKAISAYALLHGYEIEFAEPRSPWWGSIRAMLSDKAGNEQALQKWAQKLALLNRGTHNVPLATFLRRIANWKDDLCVTDLLAWNEPGVLQLATDRKSRR